ncbi:hypothetical protein DPMN_083988 [Dreissena polymorpha]|uniref:Uncharacterized protein n=1 Tax=Dreissena polymorpha TaxID=45954 RepID=A0A9D3Y9T9_DREPO|nr:hypothetical protein DPMN_083988 [Dreissena polymorpha]
MLTKPLREVAVRRPEEKLDSKCERVDVPSMDELLMAAHKKTRLAVDLCYVVSYSPPPNDQTVEGNDY